MRHGSLKRLPFERLGVDVFEPVPSWRSLIFRGKKCEVSCIAVLIFTLEQRFLLRKIANGRRLSILRRAAARKPTWPATRPECEMQRRACHGFHSLSLTLIHECHPPWKTHLSSRRASRTRQGPSTASHFFWLRISTCCSCVAFPVSWKYSLPKILFFVLRLHRKEIKVRNFSLKFILLSLCNQHASAGVIAVDNSRSGGGGCRMREGATDNLGMHPQWKMSLWTKVSGSSVSKTVAV